MKKESSLNRKSNNYIKKIFFIIFIIINIFFLNSCFNQENQKENIDKKITIKEVEDNKSISLEKEREIPDWLNILPEYNFSDIKKQWDTYSYNYKIEKTDNWEIKRELIYSKTNNWEFLWTMKLSFSNLEEKYIETIPKSFAETIDDIEFSIKPSKIINPDPIVEFTNIKWNIEIKAKKTISNDKIKEDIERQILNREFSRCEELENIEEKEICALQLVSKYRDSKVLEEELSSVDLDLTTLFWASVYAVQKQGFRKCKLVKNEDERNLCYEYTYQILVAECNSKTGKDYRTCVRNISFQLPNQNIRRLFCGYIDDKQMYNECRWTVEMSTCNEIKDIEQKMICQINIVKTQGDINLCNKVKENNWQDICRAMMGIDQANEKYCNMVKDEYYKWECLIKIALKENNWKICQKIEHKTQKDMCLAHFMIKKDWITKEMCSSFNDEFMKDTCNLLFIIQKNDYKKCDSIIDAYNKDLCYMSIAIKTKNKELCNKIILQKWKIECIKALEKPELDLPKIPDWMNCSIPKWAKLYKWNNKQQSGFRYVEPGNNNKRIGPSLQYWGPDYAQPYIFMCYNANWEKHWLFKTYNQDGTRRKEGHYKNDKLDQEVREYTNDTLRAKRTYTSWVKNGHASYYCTVNACWKWTIMSEWMLINNRKNWMWTFYKKWEFDFKSEYINWEVTRDKSGMSIKYR